MRSSLNGQITDFLTLNNPIHLYGSKLKLDWLLMWRSFFREL